MNISIIIMGLVIGSLLNIIIEKISYNIDKSRKKTFNFYIPFIFTLCCEALFFRLGFTLILAKAIAMTLILMIVSFVDIRYKVIPDFMSIITVAIGIIFAFIVKAPVLDTILGMISGGGILLLLGLVPNTIGGGDIKFMFAMGAFLGLNKTVWALLLAFSLSSAISTILIIAKIKRGKDYIAFGPFLSVGSFLSVLLFI